MRLVRGSMLNKYMEGLNYDLLWSFLNPFSAEIKVVMNILQFPCKLTSIIVY